MRVIAKVLVVGLFLWAGEGCKSSRTSLSKPGDGAADLGDSDGNGDGHGQTNSDGRTTTDGTSVVCRPDNRANGEACSCTLECASGFCVEGVCCNTSCSGTCMSCGLGDSPGTCTPTPSGAAPRLPGQCREEDRTTCGLDGTCDGTGQCRNHVPGTVCKAGTCEGDAVVGIFTCDGSRGCKPAATAVCAPFSCDPGTNRCFARCTNDANCVSGRKCVDASCGPKMNGSGCERDSECASEHCSDGFCCNSACAGECRSCNQVGETGICQPIRRGLPHPLCSQQGSSTCGTTGLCDGFGSCARYSANSVCALSTCAGATAMNTTRACDGLGTCQPSQVESCGPYRCANGRCNPRCDTAADCADGIACVNNNCGPKVDGQACTADVDCQNLHCVRDSATAVGICCNTECTGPCRSCAVTGSIGRCTPVPAGVVDPRGMCVDRGAESCATNGRCDGAGACRSYAAGTVCAAETCLSDTYTAPSACNGTGTCVKPAATACSPYHCNLDRCFAACVTNAQCIPPNSCGMNGAISSCGLKPVGATCSVANECSSGFCAQGVCCNSACTAACRACNLPGLAGACSNVNTGADPRGLCVAQAQSTCGTTGQCAAGQCARWPAGTSCSSASCLDASTRTPPSTCNGAGVCGSAATTSCAPGRCDSVTSACNSTCTADAQCTAPGVCLAGLCSNRLGNGGLCLLSSHCLSGFCVDGRCCGTACTGACQTCNNASGTCSAAANGTADALCGPAAPPCGRTGLCTGGACAVAPNGTSCSDGDACNGTESCQAGQCSTAPGTAVTCTAIDECHLAGTCANGTCSNPDAPDTTPCGTGPRCSEGDSIAQGQCGAGACIPGPSTPCPSGVCADATTCAPIALPGCGLLENCTGSPPGCVCAQGSSCSSLLRICLRG